MNAPARVLTLGLLVRALLVFQLRSTGETVPVRKSFDSFPIVLGEWRGAQATVLEVEILNVLKVSDYAMRPYTDPGRAKPLVVRRRLLDHPAKGRANPLTQELPALGRLGAARSLADNPCTWRVRSSWAGPPPA